MNVWVLKGSGVENHERVQEVLRMGLTYNMPDGKNTREEAVFVANKSRASADVVYVVTSAYHVPRATLTLRKAFADVGCKARLHVWGVGTVTSEQAESEGKRIEAYQAKGDIATWSDAT